MNYTELAPEYVRAIAPYQPGKPISEVARDLGIPEADIIKLANSGAGTGVTFNIFVWGTST